MFLLSRSTSPRTASHEASYRALWAGSPTQAAASLSSGRWASVRLLTGTASPEAMGQEEGGLPGKGWLRCTMGAATTSQELPCGHPARPLSPALPSTGNTGLPGGRFPGTLGYSCPTQTALLCLQRKKKGLWLGVGQGPVSKKRKDPA